MVQRKNGDLGQQLLKILGNYKPNYFHQLGWMPQTPKSVTESFVGLNQHLGPGGDFMYGHRRIYAHMRFSQIIGKTLSLSIDSLMMVMKRFLPIQLGRKIQPLVVRQWTLIQLAVPTHLLDTLRYKKPQLAVITQV
jgi:hypothetical protein